MAQDQSQTSPTAEAAAVKPGEKGSPLALRRSSRVRKRPSDHNEDAEYAKGASATSPASPSAQRNAKRRSTPEAFDIPENLLEASLGPWKENEQSEWASWVEVESDPAFFTAILSLLGVKGARIEEVLSVDEDSLMSLSHPVYGLVFLFKYDGGPTASANPTNQDVWFANQTTQNACATIALLNIIMNAEGLGLGEKLRKFKQETKDMSPPLRGNMINNSTWIRVAHNSFSRRLDHLDAALALQNEVDSEKRAKSLAARQSKKKPKRQSNTADKSGGSSAYHFIAYVPVGHEVWQLDGLKPAPVCVGQFTDDQHWTSVVPPVLHKIMKRHKSEELNFNLLALCGDNLADVRQKLAANIRRLADLEAKFGSSNNPDWQPKKTNSDDIICSATDSRLATYQLDAEDIQAVPESEVKQPEAPESSSDDETVESGLKLWEELAEEQKLLREQYESELGMTGQEPSAVLGRTKDYTPAIHEWVKKLADRGVLRRLHEEVKLQNVP